VAEVTDRVSQDVERLLAWLTLEWERVPQVAQEIDQWDLMEQLHFTEEWPLEEDRLLTLQRYAARGVLSADQRARFEALQRIIARHRPILQQILGK
jgi:hypothetical protein